VYLQFGKSGLEAKPHNVERGFFGSTTTEAREVGYEFRESVDYKEYERETSDLK
jgi:hypothetical protein